MRGTVKMEKVYIANYQFLNILNKYVGEDMAKQYIGTLDGIYKVTWENFIRKYMVCIILDLEDKLDDGIRKEDISIYLKNLVGKENSTIELLLDITYHLFEDNISMEKIYQVVINIMQESRTQSIKLDFQEHVRQLAKSCADYLNNCLNYKEKLLLQEIQVLKTDVFGQHLEAYTTANSFKFGIINPWPGDMSGELEAIIRIKRAAEDMGLTCVVLDNSGHILDEKCALENENIRDVSDLEFIITTQYVTPKLLDAFYYHALWNPPEIPLNLPDYCTNASMNYLMNDDFLIYDNGGMSNHLRGILINKKRNIDNASSLTASFSKSCILEPNLKNPIMFYCGMNWEKLVHNSNRHEGLFKLLDKTQKVKFYGPEVNEAWGGIRPWEGYQCYQYPIPFDGFSILKEINQCGICLVLSSDIHRRAGAETNRLYEACAAGAVIISDDNDFMLENFSDAALFIKFNKNDPSDTFEQIMAKYDWIIAHKQEALELAKKAQNIFKKYFCADKQLINIVNNHFKRVRQISNDLWIDTEDEIVLVSYVAQTLDIEENSDILGRVKKNINNQIYKNIILGIICDESIAAELKKMVVDGECPCEIIGVKMFDSKKLRIMTDGQALTILFSNIEHDYFINTRENEIWYRDHVTSLIRTMRDENTIAAYSGRIRSEEHRLYSEFFDTITESYCLNMTFPQWMPVPGEIMFHKKVHELVPMYLYEMMDGYEHYLQMAFIMIRSKMKISFTKRMTFSWISEAEKVCEVLDAEYQKRFIRDIVKFDVSDENKMQNLNKYAMKEYILDHFNIRLWFKLRACSLILKYIPKQTKIYKKLEKKYSNAHEFFLQ